ncbi:MAG: hypothetical protein IJX87_03525 [Clostridia bacterium]|nr:hypothetical protein [Clostridia bacterium]
MHNAHGKNTVRYYITLIVLIVFLFFSNDFGLIDIQKTAIVTAVGIDREEEEFILTSQIAVPQSSKQGKATQSVQIVSRGKTIADAFDEINAKTGWYPKLVFCNLILLGKKTTEQNVFDALDYFLRDEYLSDNCLLAACDGFAKDLLNTTALVDSTNSMAMEKVLSSHAERVGFVLPASLKDFAIGYFSESRCGYMPVLKTEPQQEQIGNNEKDQNSENNPNSGNDSGSASDSSSSSSSSASSSDTASSSENLSSQNSSSEKEQSSESSAQSPSSQSGESSEGSKTENKPVFSASETALFVDGKRVGSFTREETFAFGAVKSNLKLAAYTLKQNEDVCTLTIRHNDTKTKLSIGKDDRACLKVRISLRAGVLDYSKSQDLTQTKDAGDVPQGIFPAAEKKLAAEIKQVFEKCRLLGCDLFGILERLEKYEQKHFDHLKNTALDSAIVDVHVHIGNIR